MDLSKKMLEALKLRKKDEFNLGSDLVYEGIKLGEIRSKIGHRGKDLCPDVNIEKVYINNILCYKYYFSPKTKSVIFYIHGGGFYGGSALITEYCCKYLSKYSDSHIINIEYTLAPDSKFPDTMYEIYDIMEEVKKEYPDCKFGIIGDSAGAHLAMNAALLDIYALEMLSFIALYYPVISIKERKNWNISMYNLVEPCEYAKASIMFLKSVMPLISRLYLPKEYDENSKFFSMLNIQKEEFNKLPKIFIAKAEFDYFNLDIDELIQKYNIDYVEYKGLAHGFIELLGFIDEAQNLLDLTIKKFKEQL